MSSTEPCTCRLAIFTETFRECGEDNNQGMKEAQSKYLLCFAEQAVASPRCSQLAKAEGQSGLALHFHEGGLSRWSEEQV
jgi:hypothetical protein